MMLDTAAAFDALVRRNAADDEQAERILANPFYRNISGALSGTQEYMAAETLHQLHDDERFDLVVVDTPPSRNALDFLEAPGVLARFLDHRLFRLLMLPGRGRDAGRQRGDPAAAAGDRQGRRLRRARRRRGVLPGLRRHGGRLPRAGRRGDRAAALRRHALRHRRLAAPRHGHRGRLVRRPARRPGHRPDRRRRQPGAPVVRAGTAAEATARKRRPRPTAEPTTPRCGATSPSCAAYAEAERAELAPFAELLGTAPLAEVPLLSGDVHDLAGLGEIRRHLFER